MKVGMIAAAAVTPRRHDRHNFRQVVANGVG
jgi:hypothetical protein